MHAPLFALLILLCGQALAHTPVVLSKEEVSAERSAELGKQLVLAFALNNLQKGLALVDQGADIATPVGPEKNQTLLHQAVFLPKRQPWLLALLDRGAPVDLRNADGETPLFKLAHDDLALLDRLLAKGADINAQDNAGVTPLHAVAAFDDNQYLIKAMVERGAKLNTQDQDGRTALMVAAEWGKLENLIRLFELGADPEPRDKAHAYSAADHLYLLRKSLLDRKDLAGGQRNYAALVGKLARDLEANDRSHLARYRQQLGYAD